MFFSVRARYGRRLRPAAARRAFCPARQAQAPAKRRPGLGRFKSKVPYGGGAAFCRQNGGKIKRPLIQSESKLSDWIRGRRPGQRPGAAPPVQKLNCPSSQRLLKTVISP